MGLGFLLTLIVVIGLPFVIRQARSKWINCILLTIYVITVLSITLGSRKVNIEIHVVWNPLHVYNQVMEAVSDGVKEHGIEELWKRVGWYRGPLSSNGLNILLFIPLGYIVPKVFPVFHHWWKITLLGFSFSLGIEITQLISHLGWFDTSDILHNTIGAMIGYWIFCKWLQESVSVARMPANHSKRDFTELSIQDR